MLGVCGHMRVPYLSSLIVVNTEYNCLPSFRPITLSSIPYYPVGYLDFTKVLFDIRIQLAPFGEWVRPLAFCFLCQENVLLLQRSEQSSCVYLYQMCLGNKWRLEEGSHTVFQKYCMRECWKGECKKELFWQNGIKRNGLFWGTMGCALTPPSSLALGYFGLAAWARALTDEHSETQHRAL